MEIIFKDINVTINKKFILHDVCGMVKPGDMLAVMGPSGLFIYHSELQWYFFCAILINDMKNLKLKICFTEANYLAEN